MAQIDLSMRAGSRVPPAARLLSGPLTPLYRAAVAGGWLGGMWATTHWYSWQRTIDLLFGSDVVEYERVAHAAPGFTDQPLPSQHADRFVPHYLVGLVSDALQVGDRTLYYVFAFALLGVIVLLVDRLIAPLGLGRLEYAVALGALIANPYLFRFLAICPGRLADSVFIVGGLVALLGLLRANPWLLIGGLAAATLGRSEAVFPLAALAPFGVLLSGGWAASPRPVRIRIAAGALVAPLALYGLIRLVDHTFSVRDHPGFFALTIFGTVRDLPGSGGRFGLHLARILVGIAGAVAVLVGALVARRFGRYDRLPFAFWAGLAGGLAVSGEAFLLNPAWIKGSEPLLSALGAALFTVAAAAALGSLGRDGRRLALTAGLAALGALVVTSLNHRYSSISPVSTRTQFAVLTAVAATVVAAAVAFGSRPEPGRARPPA
ncbi:MAG TPA: hypothetical protein VFB35_01915 [Gaiellaceae bacterium]|nr:hypothetical protein [Gaiellaceae bacterium]